MNKVALQFEAIFTPQEEGGFTAEIPDLPGCITEGESLEEAQMNLQEAAILYLEALEERGLPLPNRSAVGVLRMNFQVPSRRRSLRYA